MQKRGGLIQKNIVEIILLALLIGLILLVAVKLFVRTDTGGGTKEYFNQLDEGIRAVLEGKSVDKIVIKLNPEWIIRTFEKGSLDAPQQCKDLDSACLCLCKKPRWPWQKEDCVKQGFCRFYDENIIIMEKGQIKLSLESGIDTWYNIYIEETPSHVVLSATKLYGTSLEVVKISKELKQELEKDTLNVPERIIATARALELDLQQQVLALKVAKQESEFKHCIDYSLVCSKDKVNCDHPKPSAVGTGIAYKIPPSYCGVFKISTANKEAYESSDLCGQETAYDVDCNILLGVTALKELFDKYEGESREYVCPDFTEIYEGNYAAIREYVGWTDCSNTQYVENIKNQDISQYNYLFSK